MTRRFICSFGFLGVVVLLQSGCATTLLSQKISSDHKYIYYHHRDEDRVQQVDAAVIHDRGDVQILYTGSQGPHYVSRSYRMTLSAKHFPNTKRAADPLEAARQLRIQPVDVARGATRKADQLNTGQHWKPLPLRTVKRLSDLDMNEIRLRAQENGETILVLFSPELMHRKRYVDNRLNGPVSIGLGVLIVAESSEYSSVLIVPYVPLKETHDFSGLGYRCLYPFAVAWDVVTFPVQAGVMIWALEDSSGGWLF